MFCVRTCAVSSRGSRVLPLSDRTAIPPPLQRVGAEKVLEVLKEQCRSNWRGLPAEQRGRIRICVCNQIIKLSADEEAFTKERALLNNLNSILVQVGDKGGALASCILPMPCLTSTVFADPQARLAP